MTLAVAGQTEANQPENIKKVYGSNLSSRSIEWSIIMSDR